VRLRKENPVLTYGKYTLIDKSNPDVYVYTRQLNGKDFLIALNFTEHQATYTSGLSNSSLIHVLGNYPEPSIQGTLKPYEAAVFALK
jgi:oligo-1,6-glucosidase